MAEFLTCPICGTDVPPKARACPECGSDNETGWSVAAQSVNGLPDRDDDEAAYPRRTIWQTTIMPIAALLCLCGFLAATGAFWMAILVPLIAGSLRLGVWLHARWRNRPSGLERQAYQQLLRQAGGDRALAERLITYEQQRNPTAPRLHLIQNAIQRWDRDRRI